MVEFYGDPEDVDGPYHKQELDYMVSQTLQHDMAHLPAFLRRELYPHLDINDMEFGYHIAHQALPAKKASKISCLTHSAVVP